MRNLSELQIAYNVQSFQYVSTALHIVVISKLLHAIQ